jgi:hypothetical protein
VAFSDFLKGSSKTPEKDRLIQLVRLILSSDKDGEILSAVYALQRTLKASGKDATT